VACGGDDDLLDDAGPAIEQHAAVVRASYGESIVRAQQLKTAVDAFIANPTAQTQEAAKQAWLAAREPYGQTEAFRFYDGPIDNPEDGPEGELNAWPLDEAYVDYVVGNDLAGIINMPDAFPTLSIELIAEQNELGAEENVSTGYHAIEFLLWGQDLDPNGDGARPHTDYIVGAGGTAANQDRRGQYLGFVTELVIDDLNFVADQWEDGAAYATEFTTVAKREAVRRMLQGMGALSGAELSGERMGTALDNRDQEDEHSCFSDNTHRDLRGNAISIQNVYLGRFGTEDGVGLDEIVAARNPDLDARMQAALEASIAAIEAIPVPFDQSIMNDTDRAKVQEAIDALQAQTDITVEIATLLGVTINLEL
jgi:putative iron-regulated protein